MKKHLLSAMMVLLVTTAAAQTSNKVEKEASADNASLIASYKDDCHLSQNIKFKDEDSSEGIAILHVDENSLMATDDLQMTFELCRTPFPDGEMEYHRAAYNLVLTNKTESTIYIDKSFCFRRPSFGDGFRYYDEDNKQPGDERIVAIAPHDKLLLSQNEWDKSPRNKRVKTAEWFLFGSQRDDGIQPKGVQIGLTKGFIKDGEEKFFTVEDSPFTQSYEITYSFAENFETYSTLKAKLYIGQIMGISTVYWWMCDYKDKGQLNISRCLTSSHNTICGQVKFDR